MSNPESFNPYDLSIPDPIDPQFIIEDSVHGQEIVDSMNNVPPMPLEDGTFYQPGNYYLYGTPYVDDEGVPVYKENKPKSSMETQRFSLKLISWIEEHEVE